MKQNRLLIFGMAIIFVAVSCNRMKDTDVVNSDRATIPRAVEPPPAAAITPEFVDEFNGTTLQTGDKKWTPYISAGHADIGLRRPSAITVANGMVTITAQMQNGQIVSGAMGRWPGQIYGYFEARVRVNADPNNNFGGVILTWPDDIAQGKPAPWPQYGENDFYEVPPGNRTGFGSNIHYCIDGASATTCSNSNSFLQGSYAHNTTEWIIVGMDWQANYLKVYVNNKLHWATTDVGKIPHVAHHLCVQLDPSRNMTIQPTSMDVDWVRIFKATFSQVYPAADPGVNAPIVYNGNFESGTKISWENYTGFSVVNNNQDQGAFCGQLSGAGQIR